MHHFEQKGGELHCEEVPLARIAAEYGTPTYVYSHATLARHFRVFDEAFAGHQHVICYSMKANSNLAVLRALVALGAGVDIVSGGELYRAMQVRADPNKIVFSGVGKREWEIEYALDVGILAFNVESHSELEAIARVAARLGKRAPISLRVNPDVDAETHPYISTGMKKNKFGIPIAQALGEYRFAAASPHLEIVGIDCHIGSQLTKVTPFRDAIARIAALIEQLGDSGIPLHHIDIGGGLGISYKEEQPPSPAEYGEAIASALEPIARMGLTILCEPGRVIVGNAGVLLTRVLYLKQGEEKNFVIVDAAMNDLIRPSFYDSFHAIVPVKAREGAETLHADIVGPICETGDFLGRDRDLARPEEGDLLAVMSAGAYGFAMASNYNSRPRAAEVMVQGATMALVRRREELEDLVRGEEIPDFVG